MKIEFIIYSFSPVDLAQKRGERGKNSNDDKVSIIGKEILCRITYPKSSLWKKIYTLFNLYMHVFFLNLQ